MNLESVDVWVLHSPYPDETWRGYEKCSAPEESDGPALFLSEQAALDYIEKNQLDGYIPVQVILVTPSVCAPFRKSRKAKEILRNLIESD